MSWSNCIIFACLLWLRRRRKGDAGHVAFRESHFGPFPHAVYIHRKRRWIAYVPTAPRKRLIPPPIFRGSVRWGDH